MIKLLYNLFIRLYPLIIHAIAPFNPKARLWIRGRQNIVGQLTNFRSAEDRIIWMHCSSLGEFEQGRPLLEKLRNDYSGYKILLTFFSPSGFEVQKNYKGADLVIYLPMDNASNAEIFFNIVQPELVLFVKYEFWYYYLREAKKRKVHLLLISGIFRQNQAFFSWYGTLHREMLHSFTHFFLQNQESAELLRNIGIQQNVTVNGDTRFDRVLQIAKNFKPISLIDDFCGSSPVIVAGSTWDDDDEELDHFANSHPEIKFIIAPHDIGTDRINDCRKLYKNSILYSELAKALPAEGINTVIIDNIGMLSTLYSYGTVCYVGGGFGDDGVHNILEAAVYGVPVVFGPEYEKFFEAGELIACGGAFSVESALELEQLLQRLMLKDEKYAIAGEAAAQYVMSKKGPTEAITQFIYENRLLTN